MIHLWSQKYVKQLVIQCEGLPSLRQECSNSST